MIQNFNGNSDDCLASARPSAVFPSSSVSIFFCIKIASQKRNKTNAKVFSANCIALRAEEIADGDDKLHELTVTLGAID